MLVDRYVLLNQRVFHIEFSLEVLQTNTMKNKLSSYFRKFFLQDNLEKDLVFSKKKVISPEEKLGKI